MAPRILCSSFLARLATLAICFSGYLFSSLAADETFASPRGTFEIIQSRDGISAASLHLVKGNYPDIPLGDAYPWPALFYVSPDDHWILQIQKTGSGENIAILYRFETNKRLWRMEQHLDDLAFAFLLRSSGISRQAYYHTGIEFVSWDPKNSILEFTVSGSSVAGSGKRVHITLKYQLANNVILAK